ncbi:MAG: sulfotransferase [Moorea sp. SIO4A3]|nr:sulfotransferase [Moorena sp. SIO4A3]
MSINSQNKKQNQLSPEYLAKKDGYEKAFKDLEKFCIFIGYPRSGHSLVGSLLDAHPNIIIAHELNVLHYIKQEYKQEEIYHLLLNNSQNYAKENRIQNDYCYDISNQWQGKFSTLKVIGDKKGGGTSRELMANFYLLETLQQTISQPIYFIHVIRNPYDNISTIFIRDSNRLSMDLEGCIELYFARCKTVNKVRETIGDNKFFHLRHEWMLSNPEVALRELCNFLGQQAEPGYLKDSVSILYKSPQRTREKVQWNAKAIDLVKKEIERFDFLKGYSYF